MLVIAVPAVIPVVAQGAGACPNEALRSELRSGSLPDCRAYEMVTPPYKEGYAALPLFVSGDEPGGELHVLVESLGVFAGAEADTFNGGHLGAVYELTRAGSGWTTTALAPSAAEFPFATPVDVSTGFDRTLWLLGTPLQQELASKYGTAGAGQADFYLRERDGAFAHIGAGEPVSAPPTSHEFGYDGASSELSHVLYSIDPRKGTLWPGDATVRGTSMYEYAGVEEPGEGGEREPVLVGVGNEGSVREEARRKGEPHVNEAAQLISRCGVHLGSVETEPGGGSSYNAISADGSRVFFTPVGEGEDPCDPGRQPKVDELYARIDGESTLDISEPPLSGPLSVPGRECAGVCKEDENEEGGHARSSAVFQGASEDGSKVFFLTGQPLVNGDEDGTMDLYEAEIKDGAVTHLVQVSHDANAGQAAEVLGVARVSRDGSHVYFVATGALTAVPDSEGQKATVGADNFYVYDTSTGETRLIALLKGSDGALWKREDSRRPIKTTPDGRFAVFTSASDLVSGDTSTVNQVFEYDSRTGALTRVSIGDEGYNDNGNTEVDPAGITLNVPGNGTEYSPGFHPAEAESGMSLSNDGSYVFFESAAGLTPQAVDNLPVANSTEATVQNVYEYHDGHVYLISDGRDLSVTEGLSGVKSVGSDASGGDVFFATLDQLVPQDTDTQKDLYDARIGGGFAAPPSLAECLPETCRVGVAPPPSLAAAGGSATAAAEDNLGASASGPVVKSKPKHKKKSKKNARTKKTGTKKKSRRAR